MSHAPVAIDWIAVYPPRKSFPQTLENAVVFRGIETMVDSRKKPPVKTPAAVRARALVDDLGGEFSLADTQLRLQPVDDGGVHLADA